MGNGLQLTGRLFRKRDVDDNSLEALPIPQLRASTIIAQDTVIIGDLTIFSRKILGNGFFGTVFEGQWCQKPCAVKVLSPLGQEFLTGLPITQQDNVQEEALLKFKKECDFMKSYEHPNIVAYYNTVFYPGCNLPVLVMELMQTSLRRYIDEGAAMSMRIQISLCCDIASALEFLHDRGLVHRDLCGDNVLLNYDQDIPVAKVSDFGISRIIIKPEQLSHSLTALGHRPGYLPPEAFSIDPTDYDSSLDIFMFGVVMTQIASQVPTVNSNQQRKKLVSELDQHSLKPLICECLSENRKDRPSASTLYLELLSVHESLRLKELPAVADTSSSRNSLSCNFSSRLWEDNSTDESQYRGGTPLMRGMYRRTSSCSNSGSQSEQKLFVTADEQLQNEISSSAQYMQQRLQQIPTLRSRVYRSHSESKFQRRDVAGSTGHRLQGGYHPRRHSSIQKQLTSSQQRWQQIGGIDNGQKPWLPHNADIYRKTHSQPNVGTIECEISKHPRATSFQNKLKHQQKLHYEHRYQYSSQNRTDMTQPFQGDYYQNMPALFQRQSSANIWPSPLPLLGDITDNRKIPWMPQDTTTTGEEFTSPKTHSQSSVSDSYQESSHVDHWGLSKPEDPSLRDEFPVADGYLFEVWLKKNKTGRLGFSIMTNTTGIVVMEIQKGGAAEENGEIKWGDMILKVNDMCVIGMSQTQVQELLANASPNVRFVLLRQHGNSATGGRGGGAKQKLHTSSYSGISLEGLPQAHVVSLHCKDKSKGFGFQIENYEESSGTYKVVVSNLTRGGVADTSGQLKVGDWILSVNGTSTLGYAVEKCSSVWQASDLIQQGVYEGQVNLLIASTGHLSPQFRSDHMGLGEWGGEEMLEGTGHGEGESRNMIKDIPEGILLKKKKKMRSLSPHRRPVGLDHHLYSKSWDEIDGAPHDNFQVGGAYTVRGCGVLNDSWSSIYSNSNLYEQAQEDHEPFPISDAESKSEIPCHITSRSDFINQKGSFNLDKGRPVNSHNIREEVPLVKVIHLHRGPQDHTLGFSIVGGKGSVYGDLPIYIKQVGEGAARQDGRLKKGDQLLAVNGISFENVTHKFAAETLKHLQGDVKLEVISND